MTGNHRTLYGEAGRPQNRSPQSERSFRRQFPPTGEHITEVKPPKPRTREENDADLAAQYERAQVPVAPKWNWGTQ